MTKRRRLVVEHHVKKPSTAWKKPLGKMSLFIAALCLGVGIADLAAWTFWWQPLLLAVITGYLALRWA